MKYDDWSWVRHKWWPFALSALFTIILWKTWIGPISLLPFVGSVVSTFGCWTNNARTIRLANLIIHNIK